MVYHITIRISSSNVYAGNKSENTEKVIPNPQTLYAKINLELDNHAISLNNKKFTVTVLRLASIFWRLFENEMGSINQQHGEGIM